MDRGRPVIHRSKQSGSPQVFELGQELQQALLFHRQGQLAQAEQVYRQILKRAPNHFDALQLLGALELQRKNHDAAIRLIRQALELNPKSAAAHFNIGIALRQLERYEEALDSFDRALAIKPDYADALNSRGNVLNVLKRPEEALENYDRALTFKPDYADALNSRGNVLNVLKRPEEALESYDRALTFKPDYAETLNNRGNVLYALKRPKDALESYDRALTIKPDYLEALNNRGNVLYALERLEEALESFERALIVKPDYAEALNNRGNVLYVFKRLEEALESYDRALTIKPDYAEALNNRGNALRDLKQPEKALESYDRALAIKPDYAGALNNRGIALSDLGRPDEALESYDRALAIMPDYAEALNNRGNVLCVFKRLEEALESYDRALTIKPDYAEALCNRGSALRDLKQPEKALGSYDRALAIKPNYAEALNNRGIALGDLRRHEEAFVSFNHALAIKPDYADAYFNKGAYKLLLGDFEEGWRLYEWRKRRKDQQVVPRVYSQPIWLGQEDIAGKTLFVYWEQGLGDSIFFCRYVKLAEAQGAKVILSTPDSLRRLLEHLTPTVQLIGSKTSPPHFDYHIPLPSMPLAFKTTEGTIPAHVPYLRAEPDRVVRWRDKIGNDGFKIGIAWQGSQGKVDFGRSFSVHNFRSIAKIPKVRLISLQKNTGVEQLSDLRPGMTVETLGEDFDVGLDAFVDTAAVMESLDLIISSDTSIAHLAGALGRPTWVALKHIPDWRWLLDRTDSLWYPTMRLYRQTSRDDWGGVFGRIAADVAKIKEATVERATTSLQIPGSIGELFDKIAILEIKAARMIDAHKLRHVTHELALLRSLESQCGPSSDDHANLVAELKRVNETLWDIENAIRECERRHDFGPDFISLARSVYKVNDRRAAIKKQINILGGSDIVEEKYYAPQGRLTRGVEF